MDRIIFKIRKKQPKRQAGRFLAVSLALVCLISSLFIPAVYAESTGQVSLPVNQVFTNTGTATPPNQTFTYRLTPKEAGNPMPEGSDSGVYTFTVTGTDGINIGPLTFNATGAYAYELVCVSDAAAGYSYDREIYTIKIIVYDDQTETVIVRKSNNEKASEILFEHSYGILASDPNIMVDPSVQKTVTGTTPADSAFTFKLTAENPSYPMPEGSENGVKTMQIIGSGENDFGTWSYTKEGIYRYTVTEVNTGIQGYTYDTEVYAITDDVKIADGRLAVSRTVKNSAGGTVTACPFNNVYTASGETVILSGNKTWNYGSAPENDRPDRITVLIKNEDKTVEEITVTEADDWKWSAELPRFDTNGSVIHYTVDEDNVPHYTHKVNGTDIVNTYVNSSYPGDMPKTGDNNNMVLWMFMMLVSSLLLVFLIFWSKHRKKNSDA